MGTFIRRAVEADISRLTEIYNWAVENTTASFDINPQTVEQRKEWFSHYNKHRQPLIVCEEEGNVAGYACLSQFRPKEGYKDTCELSVYIDPSYQRRGLGYDLMKTVIELGREEGFHTIISCITADNEVSIRMHEKYGFEFCGMLKETGFKFGRYLDFMFYQLLLKK